jgi:stress response protein YsnF
MIVFQMGQSHAADRDERPARRPLPLEGTLESLGDGWLVRLPLRAETVTAERQTVVAEEVTIRRGEVQDVVEVGDSVRREQLDVRTEGDVEVHESHARTTGRRT